MARGRSAGYNDQRQAIRDEAAQLFARQGYSATSMNQVAQACGLSKATLYHYYRDKYSLLLSIADEHVTRLQALVEPVAAPALSPRKHLERLIGRIMSEYAGARHAHRVLTEDVKFLQPQDQTRVLDKERQVVAGVARAVVAVRPELAAIDLAKPVTMLLFGMINWMFTWMRPDGALTHEAMTPIVTDLFFGGLHAVEAPRIPPASRPHPAPPLAVGTGAAGRPGSRGQHGADDHDGAA